MFSNPEIYYKEFAPKRYIDIQLQERRLETETLRGAARKRKSLAARTVNRLVWLPPLISRTAITWLIVLYCAPILLASRLKNPKIQHSQN
jgi:hypothetical protein